jgi:hypothetical protein
MSEPVVGAKGVATVNVEQKNCTLALHELFTGEHLELEPPFEWHKVQAVFAVDEATSDPGSEPLLIYGLAALEEAMAAYEAAGGVGRLAIPGGWTFAIDLASSELELLVALIRFVQGQDEYE